MASQVGLVIKNLPANTGDTKDASLIPGPGEDPLEQEMATHCSILAWKFTWTKEGGRLQSMGLQRVRYHWVTEHAQSLFWVRILKVISLVNLGLYNHENICRRRLFFFFFFTISHFYYPKEGIHLVVGGGIVAKCVQLLRCHGL